MSGLVALPLAIAGFLLASLGENKVLGKQSFKRK